MMALDPNNLKPNLLAELRQVSRREGTCLLWGRSTNQDGYGIKRLKYEGQWKNFLIHRLAYAIGHNVILTNTMFLSHLCHNTRCMELSHLVLEPLEVNNSQRKTCSSRRECTGNHNFQGVNYPNCIF